MNESGYTQQNFVVYKLTDLFAKISVIKYKLQFFTDWTRFNMFSDDVNIMYRRQ